MFPNIENLYENFNHMSSVLLNTSSVLYVIPTHIMYNNINIT